MNTTVERRKLARCVLKWPLLLWRRESVQAASGVTRDISSEGFYCCTTQSFLPGECLDCCVEMMSLDQTGCPVFINLHCRVEVVRVDVAGTNPEFGLACRLLSYSILLRQTSLLAAGQAERPRVGMME